MPSSANTNYGVTLGEETSTPGTYTTIGEVVSVDPPELLNPTVEATNHGSGGVRQYISSKLMELTEFKAVVNQVPANLDPLVTFVEGGTKSNYQIGFVDGDKITFAAFITGIKPGSADAQNPEAQTAEITFRPTDTFTFMSS